VEEAIRAAVARLKPGDVVTAERLARQLDLEQTQVAAWLDLLAADGLLIPEHRVLSEAAHAKPVIQYRVPQYG